MIYRVYADFNSRSEALDFENWLKDLACENRGFHIEPRLHVAGHDHGLLEPLGSESRADLAQRTELDGCTQGVAHCAAQERAANSVPGELAHFSIAARTAAPKSFEL